LSLLLNILLLSISIKCLKSKNYGHNLRLSFFPLRLSPAVSLYPTNGLRHESRRRKQNAHKSFLNARAEAGDRLYKYIFSVICWPAHPLQWHFLVSRNELGCVRRRIVFGPSLHAWGHHTPSAYGKHLATPSDTDYDHNYETDTAHLVLMPVFGHQTINSALF
jgi:hypothetical protein